MDNSYTNMKITVKIVNANNALALRIKVNSTIKIELEDYIFGVVAKEINNANYQACCAQAIASRTLAYYHHTKDNIISDDSSRWQAFRAKALNEKHKYPNISKAIDTTKNMILFYDGDIVTEPVFSANNGGKTVSAKERWDNDIPYLISQIDKYDSGKKRGHGVGLSQEGAIARAKDGQSYQDILSFYYPGTYIGEIGMSNKIKVNDLIDQFQTMYNEHWDYEWGAAKKGCVDCSGAFVYAYKQLNGPSIAHGSNSIFHKYCEAPISKDEVGNKNIIGNAAFKVREWSSKYSTNAWYNQNPGDVYHIGLVDRTGRYVLNAKSTSAGFSLDPISSWQYFAPLKAVDYSGGTIKMNTPYYALVTTKSTPLNLREEPDSDSDSIAKMPKGETVLVKDEIDNWAIVEYNGITGYANLSYLAPISPATDVKEKDKITITIPANVAKELLDALSAEMTD